MSTARGTLVTEDFEFDGGRGVTVYVPSEPPEAIIYAGDGQLTAPWGEVLAATDGLPVTMVVGAHRLDDEMERLNEYSPFFGSPRFEAHERFFVEDVRQWVATRFGVSLAPERTAVLGVSASGELSLAMGVRHPDVYGAVFCASPGGGYRPPETVPVSMPPTYLVAGLQEPFFLENAARWRDALEAAGRDVVMTEREGGHGDPFWRDELPLMAAWAFGSNG